jgi:hypothetical protein
MNVPEEGRGGATHHSQTPRKVKKKIVYDSLDWMKGDLVDNHTDFLEQSYEQLKTLTLVEICLSCILTMT